MLQQTSVAAVIPRFQRFVERWPDIAALAAAADADILAEWAGLGYYARARNLIACAREVAANGGFPTTAAELRKLPGLGAYTSAAIAAIAFGERSAAVDTNVARVIARLHALERPRRAELERLTLDLMPLRSPGDFIQAMMDLGATICRPKAPRCIACPLQSCCAGFAIGTPEHFPAAKQKRERPHRFGTAYWIERQGSVWLVRRPAKGLLGGMAALPGNDWTPAGPDDAPPALGSVRHVFTHFSLDLAIVAHGQASGDGWWQPLDRLGEAGLPTLYRKAAALALNASDEASAAA
ncbi:MAG: NUDIX domain-containing protein [Sphingomicrobium sp.]